MSDPVRPEDPRDLFAEKLELLERMLAEEGLDEPADEADVIPRRAPESEPELSFAQRRLWFLHRWDPASASYNVADALQLEGRLSVGVLKAALGRVVARHEVLRTTFREASGEPRAVVREPRPVALPVVDLGGLPAARREERVDRSAEREALRPFDLEAGPLLRSTLLRTGSERWVLLVTMHHIVADAWSVQVLVRELTELYGALLSGRQPRLAPLPLQYSDYAAWQRGWLAGPVLEEQVAWWRDSLAGAPEVLPLPLDRPRPAVRSPRGFTRTTDLLPAVAGRLRQVARAHSASPFMVLLALVATLLARLSGVRDLVVGSPIANRTRAETEPLIGFFVNTLPLRVDLSGRPSLSEVVARVRDRTLLAYGHQDVPFEVLVERLQPERSLRHTPLFQVMLAYQEGALGADLELPELDVSRRVGERGTAKFDLTLVFEGEGDRFTAAWEASRDVFEPATVERLQGMFVTLATAALESPETPLDELPLLSAAERRQLVTEWGGASESSAERFVLPQRFAAVASRRGGSVAVRYGERELTYGELAAPGVAAGVAPGGSGGGSGGAGGSVPGALGGAGGGDPRGAVGGGRLRAPGPGGAGGTAGLRAGGQRGAGGGGAGGDGGAGGRRPGAGARPGGAGRGGAGRGGPRRGGCAAAGGGVADAGPRGVRDLHVGLDGASEGRGGDPRPGVAAVHGDAGLVRLRRVGRVDAVPQLRVRLLGVGAVGGAALRRAAGGGAVPGEPLAAGLPGAAGGGGGDGAQPDAVGVPPAGAGRGGVAAEAEQAATALPELSLRSVVFGGEALELEALRPWLLRHGEERPRLVNMYGITETTVHVTYRPVGMADLERGTSPIGRGIPDLGVYVVDRRLEPVPAGVAGEVCVGGGGVARGYLGRPGLTAERFVPDPFGGEPGARLYRSGDLGRWRAGGDLEYLGRSDQQVKVRGFRIEPGEIEAAVATHPAVSDVAVVLREDAPGDRRLVAYVVAAPDAQPAAAAALREHAARRLPDYMVPAAFVLLDRLPLTVNGKLDRAALPVPGKGDRRDDAYEPPRGFEEEVLAAVWSRVLGVDKVGRRANFFALGGDSILSLRIVALAAERGLEVPLQEIFRHQTLADLAAAVAASPAADREAEEVARDPFSLVSAPVRGRMPADVEDAYPLTRLQAGMLYHMRLDPDHAPYHNVDSWHLRLPYDPDALREAVARVVAVHPVLRTGFDLESFDEPLQLVYDHAELEIREDDLRGGTDAEQEAAVSKLTAAAKRRPFDLADRPQLRFHVLRRADDRIQLTLTENHAIFDGWSLYSTLGEIFDVYFRLLAGEDPRPVPPRTTFRQFVALERRSLDSAEATAFWARRLDGMEPSRLPRDLREGERRRRSLHLPVGLPEDVGTALQGWAREWGIPLKNVLLAAHLVVLGRFAGRDEVTTGLTYHGRPEGADGARVRGLFLNTLPFRLRLTPGAWRELVQATLEEERLLFPHRRYPMAEVQRRLGGEPFEAAFNFTHFHAIGDLLGSGRVEVLGSRTDEGTNLVFQAHFNVDPASGRLALELEYDAARIADELAHRLATAYGLALADLASDPGRHHERADLLDEHERHRLLVEWSGAVAAGPGDSRVPRELVSVLRRVAAASPAAVAVACGERAWTYRQLAAAGRLLAGELAARGVAAEVRVGVLLERSPEMALAVLAILEAGGTFVPLDPAWPDARLAFVLADAGVSVVVAAQPGCRRLAELEAPPGAVLDLDLPVFRERLEAVLREPGEPDAEPLRVPDPRQLAYVIYTSGSTGRPKGVMVHHGGLAAYLSYAVDAYRVAEGRGAPLATPLTFDLSITALLAPLLAGRRVEMVPAEPAVDALAEQLRPGADWSFVKLTPAHLEALEGRLEPGAAATAALVVGGEALQGSYLAAWRRRDPALRVINEYGPTETVVGCSAFEVPPGEPASGAVPIGQPVAGARLYVLDSRDRLAPIGVAGHLQVAGPGVSRGYLGRPRLTAERFRPCPFGGVAGDRAYATGDVVRFLPDGRLVYLGRCDDQVKVRGHRVEPGEVEAALVTDPAVAEAIVGVRGEGARRRLVAWIVARPEAEPAPEALRERLRRLLPEPLVPGAWVFLDVFPLTAHGKIDRRALPDPATAVRSTAAARPPSGPVEEVLAAIWAEVLDVDRVGADEDFFELGGHSLLASRVFARLRRTFGVELPLATLFAHPTVAGLARAVEAVQSQSGPAAPPLLPVAREGGVRLSFAQERLWFIDRFEPNSAAYNVPAVLRLRGALATAALAGVLADLLRRHEVLRTRFEVRDGKPVQVVTAAVVPTLPRIGLAGLPAARREAAARRVAASVVRRPFDLTAGNPLRAALVTVAPEDHLLVLSLHHIVSDAGSAEILVREASALYAEAVTGRPADLPELPIQYADYAAWQRRRFDAAVLATEVEWWRDHLAGAPPVLEVPTDRPRPARLSDRGGLRRRTLPPDLVAGLRRLGRDVGSSSFMTGLGVFQLLLARYSGRHDLTVGTPVAGRDRLETESLIGFFVNTLVLRANLAGRPTAREVLVRARDEVLLVHAHRELPFEKLVEELAPERRLNVSPLFQAAFVFQEGAHRDFDLPGLEVVPVEEETGTAKFDLTLSVAELREDTVAAVEYRSELYDAATAERLLEHYERLLAAAVASPEAPAWELPLLSAAERRQLVTEWGGASESSAERFVLPQRFAAVASRRGGSVAVRYGERQLTYGELASRASRLASRLVDLGVGPEVRVGLCLERSEELVVAILGVLWAGGAYVPLDPEAPAERLAYVLEDSAAPVVVARGETAARVAGGPARVLDLAELDVAELDVADPGAAGALLPVAASLTPDHAAYVIYTSGSTGRPKGVVVTHGQVSRLFTATQGWFGFGESDVWTLFHSYAFDFSVWELWGALLYGGRLVVVPYLVSRSPRDFRALLAAEGVTVLNQTPSAFRQLVRAEEELAAEAEQAATVLPELSLRSVVFGGEALELEALRPWLLRHGEERPRLVNMYGITETTVHVTYRPVGMADLERGTSPIGRGIPDLGVYVVDRRLEPVPAGVAGEVCVGGGGVARGYLGRPGLTAERFVPDPFGGEPGARLYRSGDLGRWRAGGDLEYLGRSDQQVKVRGFRIEPGEIEAAVATHPAVSDVAVVLREDAPGERRLVAYVVAAPGAQPAAAAALREHAARRLPDYMVPAAFVLLDRLPLTVNGKLDRAALPAPSRQRSDTPFRPPSSALEASVAQVWAAVLGVERVGADDNFFDLGGHSLLLLQVQGELREVLGQEVPVVELFQNPTVRSLALALGGQAAPAPVVPVPAPQRPSGRVAVVGMAGRFPGAPDVDAFWRNLREGVESISRFGDDELAAAGVSEEERARPDYVAARAVLDEAGSFDAAFFGFSPREAEVTNPQHRLFLEVAWEALEDAARDPRRDRRRVGVFAGSSLNGYWFSLVSDAGVRGAVDGFQITLGNDKDYLASRVAYKLDLTGPAVTTQTACSTSLVAVHLACRSLLAGECETALAGGVSVQVPQRVGYLYQEGGINSPDGHCRPFDAAAGGTVSGDGVGIVVLKRFEDAVRDGDRIRAVIRGSAMNNDGAGKVGFTAPGVDGQAAVIREALAAAGVEPGSIGYVEAHGTGTPLGDPVEMAALRQAFGPGEAGRVAVGSLKSNVGHLDAAAGVAGLIKTVLALEHAELPPSLHFERLNPRIDLAGSPFFVNRELRPWTVPEGEADSMPAPRRAGVSSFGIGGTNVHVVLEEAPPAPASERSLRRFQLLLASARSEAALERIAARLADRLEGAGETELADVAHTLRVGRRTLPHRRFLVVSDAAEAVRMLRGEAAGRGGLQVEERLGRGVAWLFPGQGSQHPGMGRHLYRQEPSYRRWVDDACELLEAELGRDLRPLLLASPDDEAAAADLRSTQLAQPALFVVEHALARWWEDLGVRPQAMLGHSLGELVAATVAGVFELPRALSLVAARGRMMAGVAPGAMLAVPLSEAELTARLEGHLHVDLAAVNGPALCVVSGPSPAVARLERQLVDEGLAPRRLVTSHAFHSSMMEPVVERFVRRVEEAEPREPRIPFLSNLTGTWITPAQATDPVYWGRQLREPVRFSAALDELLRDGDRVLLEVGPGRTLSTLTARHPAAGGRTAVASQPRPAGGGDDDAVLSQAVGALWSAGVELDWTGMVAGEARARVTLPTYPFERLRYWAGDGAAAALPPFAGGTPRRRPLEDWFYTPSWHRVPRPRPLGRPGRQAGASAGGSGVGPLNGPCLALLADDEGVGAAVADRLAQGGVEVVRRSARDLDPRDPESFRGLLDDLARDHREPRRILFDWGVRTAGDATADPPLEGPSGDAFYALLHLARALAARRLEQRVEIVALTVGAAAVGDDRELIPAAALLGGLGKVIALEAPDVAFRSFDLAAQARPSSRLVEALILELEAGGPVAVAFRGAQRWVAEYVPLRLPPAADEGRLRSGGVYLITGGFGEAGSLVAEHLVRRADASLALVSRTALPPRDRWDAEEARRGPAAERIALVRHLEELGGRVLPLVADASDPQAMSRAAERAHAHFGRLDGLVHAAGERAFDREAGVFHPLDGLDPAECERQIGSRSRSLRVLGDLADHLRPDFCLVCSSLASVVGLLGSAAYPAAHAWLDAFVRRRQAQGGVPWLVVDWDNLESRDDEAAGRPVPEGEPLVLRREAREVLDRVLAVDGVPQVIVSSLDLEQQLARWVELGRGKAAAATAHARPNLDVTYRPPAAGVESLLAGIWSELLGLDRVGGDDDFFALGGDSVISIQMIARARQAGVELTPQQIFEHPTVAALAAVAGSTQPIRAEQAAVVGEAPLTPIQRWFFSLPLGRPEHWNQAMLLTVPTGTAAAGLGRLVDGLVAHHDALRLQFPAPADAAAPPAGRYAAPDALGRVFARIDLGALPAERITAALEVALARVQGGFDLVNGPLVRVLHVDLGGGDGRLALIGHHLVCDAVSWRILLDDLAAGHRRMAAGEVPRLPAKTTSYREWARRLAVHALDEETLRQRTYWEALDRATVPPLPLAGGGEDRARDLERVEVALDEETTRELSGAVATAFGTRPHEVVLAAVVGAVAAWSGADRLLVDVEGHGREPLFPDVDLSRTVGWFTALYPVLFRPPAAPSAGGLVLAVKEQLRAVPGDGLGWGLLRYLGPPEVRQSLAALPAAQVSYLYLGRTDGVFGGAGGPFGGAAEDPGPAQAGVNPRPHPLEIKAAIAEGRLRVAIEFGARAVRREAMAALAEEMAAILRRVVEQATSGEEEIYTPSDFRRVDLDQEELDELLSELQGFEE